ncbi:MAG: hypothetical protein RLZZ618_223 [Pseudomonadota bacterium]|jgi:hypothetical protein
MNKLNWKIAAALAVSIAAAGPALAVDVDVKYAWADRENPNPQPQTQVCPVQLVPAADIRQNKETVGQTPDFLHVVSGAPLVSGDLAGWVTDGLGSLKSYGFTVTRATDATPPREGVLIKPTLTRAYTWQVGLKIFSMVALKVQFIDRNGVLQEKYYRAHGDKTNMWGAASEYSNTLNYGLNNILPAMAKDLVSLCQGRTVEAYTYSAPEAAVVRTQGR